MSVTGGNFNLETEHTVTADSIVIGTGGTGIIDTPTIVVSSGITVNGGDLVFQDTSSLYNYRYLF